VLLLQWLADLPNKATCAPGQLGAQLAVLSLQLLDLALCIQQLLRCAALDARLCSDQGALGCLLRAGQLCCKPVWVMCKRMAMALELLQCVL
jgi:hypothetical protein